MPTSDLSSVAKSAFDKLKAHWLSDWPRAETVDASLSDGVDGGTVLCIWFVMEKPYDVLGMAKHITGMSRALESKLRDMGVGLGLECDVLPVVSFR